MLILKNNNNNNSNANKDNICLSKRLLMFLQKYS